MSEDDGIIGNLQLLRRRVKALRRALYKLKADLERINKRIDLIWDTIGQKRN
ncbi:MAG: hypothetical protein ACTSQI_07780 [Candidatus Helarchaeota archaeon]